MSVLPNRVNGDRVPSLLGGYFALLILLLYLPLFILLLFSINTGTVLVFPLSGFTLDWYRQATDTPAAIDAVKSSVMVAIGSGTAATGMALLLAIVITRYSFRGKQLLAGLAALPLIVPAIVLGVALLLLFTAAGIERSLQTVVIAHSVIGIPYALLIIGSRMAGMPPALEDAAMDLGASYPIAVFRVVLPIILPAIVAAWIVAFTVSFDEFALALFLTGSEPTLPVYIYGQLRFASRFPMLVALVMIVMLGSLALAMFAEWIRRRQ